MTRQGPAPEPSSPPLRVGDETWADAWGRILHSTPLPETVAQLIRATPASELDGLLYAANGPSQNAVQLARRVATCLTQLPDQVPPSTLAMAVQVMRKERVARR